MKKSMQSIPCVFRWIIKSIKMVGDDRMCVVSYFTILIANLCMQYVFKILVPWILMIEHDENQLNLVVKPFARHHNVWEFCKINYCGWWNVGLCVQSWHKATISTEKFRIITQAKEAWQRRLNVKTIVLTFFLVFKQWVGSCTRPFYRICENHCERNDQNLAGTQPLYLPWEHSCAHCILYSVFHHKKQNSGFPTADFFLFPKLKVWMDMNSNQQLEYKKIASASNPAFFNIVCGMLEEGGC